jgi:hypothetical protein
MGDSRDGRTGVQCPPHSKPAQEGGEIASGGTIMSHPVLILILGGLLIWGLVGLLALLILTEVEE